MEKIIITRHIYRWSTCVWISLDYIYINPDIENNVFVSKCSPSTLAFYKMFSSSLKNPYCAYVKRNKNLLRWCIEHNHFISKIPNHLLMCPGLTQSPFCVRSKMQFSVLPWMWVVAGAYRYKHRTHRVQFASHD